MLRMFKSEDNKVMVETANRLQPMIQDSRSWNEAKRAIISDNACTPKDIQRLECGISQFVAIEFILEFKSYGKQMSRKRLFETINRVVATATKGLSVNLPVTYP